MTTLQARFSAFLKAGLYLKGWSPKTSLSYQQAGKSLGETELSKSGLETWIIGLRQRGLKPGGINAYIRCLNSFLSWLREEGEANVPPSLKLLKSETRVLETFSDLHVKSLLEWKAKKSADVRLKALLHLLIDTGLRIEEALTLTVKGVDFDNLLVTVMGKGSKERRIPFSLEARKTLWQWHTKREKVAEKKVGLGTSPLFFAAISGNKLRYRNIHRDIKRVCEALGIVGPRISPHTFRHTFATRYLRAGGDIYRLGRMLGHTDIRTTMRYLHLQAEDLRLKAS